MSFFCFKLLKQCPFISHVYILLIYVDICINVLYFLYIYVNVWYIIFLLYLFEGVGYCGVYSLLPAHLCCVLLRVLARVRGRSSTSLLALITTCPAVRRDIHILTLPARHLEPHARIHSVRRRCACIMTQEMTALLHASRQTRQRNKAHVTMHSR